MFVKIRYSLNFVKIIVWVSDLLESVICYNVEYLQCRLCYSLGYVNFIFYMPGLPLQSSLGYVLFGTCYNLGYITV